VVHNLLKGHRRSPAAVARLPADGMASQAYPYVARVARIYQRHGRGAQQIAPPCSDPVSGSIQKKPERRQKRSKTRYPRSPSRLPPEQLRCSLPCSGGRSCRAPTTRRGIAGWRESFRSERPAASRHASRPGCPGFAPRVPFVVEEEGFATNGRSDEGGRSELREFWDSRASSAAIRAVCCWMTASSWTINWRIMSSVCSQLAACSRSLLAVGEKSPRHPLIHATGGLNRSQAPFARSTHVISAPSPPPTPPPPAGARTSSPWLGTARWQWTAQRRPAPAVPSRNKLYLAKP
jgi:hypothetical protein